MGHNITCDTSRRAYRYDLQLLMLLLLLFLFDLIDLENVHIPIITYRPARRRYISDINWYDIIESVKYII